MHEMAITKSMIGILRKSMRKNKVKKLRSVKIKVGELVAVDPESLRFCFETCVKGTSMNGAELLIEEVPVKGRCLECGNLFELRDFKSVCVKCKGRNIEKITGDELEIVSMEAV